MRPEAALNGNTRRDAARRAGAFFALPLLFVAFAISACSPSSAPRTVEFHPDASPSRTVAFPAKKPSAAVQCGATAKNGERCTRRTKSKSGVCWMHASARECELSAMQAEETAAEHLGTCKADADECAACRAFRLAPKAAR
jgi:hypothetical protein